MTTHEATVETKIVYRGHEVECRWVLTRQL